MFFILSKIAWFVIQPLVALALVAILGLLFAAFGLRGPSITLLAFSGIAYALIVFSPAGLLMVGVLEDRFPRPELPAAVTGIIVLGGSFDTQVARTRGDPEMSDAGDRITGALALSRRYPDARVVFTGGVAAVFEDDMPEYEIAKVVFASLGLPPERLELEGRARNTTENAVFTKEMVKPKPGETWLLVTSAFHMPRSVGCFRAIGFDVVPYPVDYRTPSGPTRWRPAWNDVSRNADKVQLAVREYIGLAAYRLSGHTSALFPGPSDGPAADARPSR